MVPRPKVNHRAQAAAPRESIGSESHIFLLPLPNAFPTDSEREQKTARLPVKTRTGPPASLANTPLRCPEGSPAVSPCCPRPPADRPSAGGPASVAVPRRLCGTWLISSIPGVGGVASRTRSKAEVRKGETWPPDSVQLPLPGGGPPHCLLPTWNTCIWTPFSACLPDQTTCSLRAATELPCAVLVYSRRSISVCSYTGGAQQVHIGIQAALNKCMQVYNWRSISVCMFTGGAQQVFAE